MSEMDEMLKFGTVKWIGLVWQKNVGNSWIWPSLKPVQIPTLENLCYYIYR